MPDGEELFKIIARQKLCALTAQNDKQSRYSGPRKPLESEMEALSLKYQIMSKYTSFLCINKNDGEEKPTEELKQVEV